MANLPVHAFSGSISKSVYTAKSDDVIADSFRNLVDFRQGATSSTCISAQAGEMFEYSTPIVAIIDENNLIVGHLSAENVAHASSTLDMLNSVSNTTNQSPSQLLSQGTATLNMLDKAVRTENTTADNINESTTVISISSPICETTATTISSLEMTPESRSAVLEVMLRPLELKTKDYVRLYAPDSLRFWVVPDNISVIELFKTFVTNHLHHVWVADNSSVTVPTQVSEEWSVKYNDVKGIITLTDALRWLARDNLWLKASHVPVHFLKSK